METRVSVITIVIDVTKAERAAVDAINKLLSDAGIFVIGRMGIPYREKGANIITIIVDAPQNVTSTLSGKIGKIDGVCVKTSYTNVRSEIED